MRPLERALRHTDDPIPVEYQVDQYAGDHHQADPCMQVAPDRSANAQYLRLEGWIAPALVSSRASEQEDDSTQSRGDEGDGNYSVQ